MALYKASPYLPDHYDLPRSRLLEQALDPDHQLAWESICLDRKLARSFRYTVRALIGSVLCLGLCYGTLFATVKIGRCQFPKKAFQHRWLVSAIVCHPAIVTCLAIFVYFRNKINHAGGALTKDQEWSFGQVLALATWAPVCVEFLYLWCQGAKEGMTSQMMAPFEAVASEADENVPELIVPDVKEYVAVDTSYVP